MKKLALLILAFAAILVAPPALGQNPDLNITGSSPYTLIGLGIPWSQMNRVYYFTPLSPESTVCVYIVNNNPTNSHTLTMNIFQTGDPTVQGFSANQGRWSAAGVQGSPSPIAASQTGTGFAITNAAAQIAIKISGTSGAAGNPDTADAYVVQTAANNCGSVANGIQIIQGTVAVGSQPSGNPVLGGCAGDLLVSNTAAGAVQWLPCDNTTAIGAGLLIGHAQAFGQGQTIGNDANCFWNNNQPCNPLMVTLTAPNSTGTGQALQISNGFNAGGSLLFTHGGMYKTVTATYTTNTTTTILNFPQSTAGIAEGCSVIVDVAGPVTGTSPSLSMIFQDSDGVSGTFQDRISFNAFTAAGFQRAAIWNAPNTGVVPYTPTSGSLAAGTVINGPILPTMRMLVTVSGTTPSFGNVSTFVNCW